MIYKKDANFPYPILSSNTFEESDFMIKVNFEEDGDLYKFKIQNNLTSEFI
ncbi:hypothetical protein PVA17_24625 [Lysinibacillus sp. CNPSo 3705]|uniref:hypothetical protein n=1 Tax=Lysinibacillus sp. CNPSo 3705 TaxID=3028148 RepID=UPI002363FE9E|nr:hypothetical protein [Lysinibacillus sp. CNPSo 3705]MDD1505902.1 hypothetical protein [Lysinibacillus sp. CNPSo 3705]